MRDAGLDGPTFDIGPDEMEFGVGIHGEPGRRRDRVKPAAEIVEQMTTAILSDLDPPSGSNVLAFVNGLGGTPLIELYVIYNELTKQLEQRGLTATRNLVGNYITSLEMAGVSITLLTLDDELTALWDAPVHTPALRWGVSGLEGGASVDADTVRRWLDAAAASLREQRDYLTQLDAAIGDADHGANMDRGFTAVVERLDGEEPSHPPGKLLTTAGSTLVSTVGGASGPLWGTALRRAGRALGDAEAFGAGELVAALDAALDGVVELGAASEGEKTMVDALAPAVRALRERVDGRRRPRRRRSPPRARPARKACGRPCRSRREGPRVLPRRAEHRPPGSGRHLDDADPRGARAVGRGGVMQPPCSAGLAALAGVAVGRALVRRDARERGTTGADVALAALDRAAAELGRAPSASAPPASRTRPRSSRRTG